MVGDRIKPPVSPPAPDRATSFKEVSEHLNDARTFAAIYVATQTARLKNQAEKLVLYGLMGLAALVLGLIAVATVGVVSVVFVCEGLAGAIGALLNGRLWAGELIVGSIVLGGTILAGLIAFLQAKKAIRRQTVSNYLKAKSPL